MVESRLRIKGILDNSLLSLSSIKLKGATYTITLEFFLVPLMCAVVILVTNNILRITPSLVTGSPAFIDSLSLRHSLACMKTLMSYKTN